MFARRLKSVPRKLLPRSTIFKKPDDAERERGRVGNRNRQYILIPLEYFTDNTDIGGDERDSCEFRFY